MNCISNDEAVILSALKDLCNEYDPESWSYEGGYLMDGGKNRVLAVAESDEDLQIAFRRFVRNMPFTLKMIDKLINEICRLEITHPDKYVGNFVLIHEDDDGTYLRVGSQNTLSQTMGLVELVRTELKRKASMVDWVPVGKNGKEIMPDGE